MFFHLGDTRPFSTSFPSKLGKNQYIFHFEESLTMPEGKLGLNEPTLKMIGVEPYDIVNGMISGYKKGPGFHIFEVLPITERNFNDLTKSLGHKAVLSSYDVDRAFSTYRPKNKVVLLNKGVNRIDTRKYELLRKWLVDTSKKQIQ